MARRRKTLDPIQDLPKIMEILERELTVQRQAMDRLKQLASAAPRPKNLSTPRLPIRRSA
jgi:hypothetical protein